MPETKTKTMTSSMSLRAAGAWSIDTPHYNAFMQEVQAIVAIQIGGREPAPLTYNVVDGAAHIPIGGILLNSVPSTIKRWDRNLATGYDEIREMVAAAVVDESVDEIVYDVDSPGGMVAGLDDTAATIRNASDVKPSRAVVGVRAMSAAYYLIAQTHEIAGSKDAHFGSIGTFTYVYDFSGMAEQLGIKAIVIKSGEYKGMAVPGAPISQKQIEGVQEIVDTMAEHFIEAVATGRGMKKSAVRKLATGQYWLAEKSLELGLIDKIQTVGNFSVRKEETMTEKNDTASQVDGSKIKAEATEQANKANTERVSQIEAAFGDDPAFALEQIKKGNDVTQAKAEYADVLAARNEELRKKLEAKTENRAVDGAPPVGHGGDGGTGTADFVVEAKRMGREGGTSYAKAARQLAKDQPELHEAYVAKQRANKVAE